MTSRLPGSDLGAPLCGPPRLHPDCCRASRCALPCPLRSRCSLCPAAGAVGPVPPFRCSVPVPRRVPGCRGVPAALGGGESRRLLALVTGPCPRRGGPAKRVLHLHPPASPSPRRPCELPRPPFARSSEAQAEAQVASKPSGHSSSHSLRIPFARCVPPWVPPSSRCGVDGAPWCPPRLGQLCAFGRSGGLALAGRRMTQGVRQPPGARFGPLMARQPRGLAGQGRGGLCGGSWAAARGGRGHGPPEVRRLAGPGGRVAPGLCTAPEIAAQGGRGARPRAKPAGPPAVPGRGPPPRGGGWREREEGGGLAEAVLVVLVGVEFEVQVEVARPRLGTVVRPWLVPRGGLLHGGEGSHGRDEAGWRRTR